MKNGGAARPKAYWRSLDELAETAEFRAVVEREFPTLVPEILGPTGRRSFMKLMGASVALAGLTACRWPKERILPYAHRPEGRTPGVPEYYASAMELNGVATALLVKSVDGRPIKIEGNPEHPESRGASSPFAQAAVLGLYDPDRSHGLVERTGGQEFQRSWDEFATFAERHFGALRASGGRGLAVLAEPSPSVSAAWLRARFLEVFPHAGWFEHTPVGREAERAGTAQAFGVPMRPVASLAAAEVVVSFESDLLQMHPAALAHARDVASRRRADDGTMNRLWVLESTPSITGASADERIAMTSGEVAAAAQRLLAGLLLRPGVEPAWMTPALRTALAALAGEAATDARIDALREDLLAHRGHSYLAAGPTQPPVVHALVALANVALGNVGTTVRYLPDPDAPARAANPSLVALAEAIDAGQVQTLIVLGGNPAYDAPADLDFAARLSRAGTVLHLALERNETSALASWHLPRAHWLETWGDARSWDGTVSVAQPLIQPLFDGRSPIELLALVAGLPQTKGYELVRQAILPLVGSESGWRRALHDGLVAGSAPAPIDAAATLAVAAAADPWPWSGVAPAQKPSPQALELVFLADRKVYDGRFANNAWLQEFPDPITKLTWDNALLVAPRTADALGVGYGDVVTVTSDGRSIQAPIYILPGQAENSVALALGYGRRRAGRVGDKVGANAYALRTASAPWVASATVQRTGLKRKLATTQDHWGMDALGERTLQHRVPEFIKEATLAGYQADPEFARKGVPKLIQLWDPHTFDGNQWGMAIDLSACTGCGACMVACQAENNIPVVGREQVLVSRDMHWIRVDRYFKGDPNDPEFAFQPVACVHCENAPCEQVCPVQATVHDHEGINEMVYNRCVGTRYCANNCPYKVRRFNFFNWHKGAGELGPLARMAMNPDVTVRSRGVMEKCTYCVQRISAVKIAAKNEARPIRDGEIVTACEQACPSQAIVFGNLNDVESRVAKLQKNGRAYALLAELNVRPRTQYLARLKNPVHGAEAPAGGAHGASEEHHES
ncbi:MAG: TAT-variant-translocated molybdopterin oxidoreductase [Acidobacteria bacterium]|nr:TAT-variant-translocated molybdopterin oxidoreductase [Acidobacteriota bacterium]